MALFVKWNETYKSHRTLSSKDNFLTWLIRNFSNWKLHFCLGFEFINKGHFICFTSEILPIKHIFIYYTETIHKVY